jgi:hypothetical protein
MCVFVCVRVFLVQSECDSRCMCLLWRVHMFTCVDVSVCIYLFVFLCLYLCMRVYVCVCRWVVYVSLYMCTCVNL